MNSENKTENKILTIPNLLSLFRLILIPVIIWLYWFRKDYFPAGVLLIISGLTDLADGYIARHFNAVSNIGKILDPIADKLTQAAMLFCLVTRFPLMAAPFGFLVIKEGNSFSSSSSSLIFESYSSSVTLGLSKT